ncbi:MAG: class F420-dependent oxidoreductase [Frankiales bacterium]|nr:class F420-dependent oxidoreductase [Frankiales bacterium]
MKLGLNMGYWGMGNDANNLELAKEADRLGYSVAWVAEAYGSDAPTILSWVAAQTTNIDIGSAIFQIPGRTPANCAMTAATLDSLSGGRFRLGLGVSGPQVSEGWHGVRFDKPLGRTREYVEIVNMALSRQKVKYDGEHYVLPLPDGPGKALQLTVHPVREHIPTYLASVGPKNLELTGELFDGWLGIFYSPEYAKESLNHIETGRAKVGKTLEGFDVVPSMPIVIGDDPRACADPIRWYAALYVGGMGSREKNFYNQLAVRMGYDEAAKQVQDLYLDRKYDEAAAAVPFEFLDETALLGSKERIADRMQVLAASGVTTLTITPTSADLEGGKATLRTAVEALELSGVGS